MNALAAFSGLPMNGKPLPASMEKFRFIRELSSSYVGWGEEVELSLLRISV
jgi:hypothetical protein